MSGLSRRRFLTISACVALAGSARSQTPPERLVWRGTALGADVSITLDGPAELTRPAMARARLEIAGFEARFSLYRADSDLSHLNRAGHLPDLDPRWLSVLSLSDDLHRATGGRFDPTIQPLWLAHAQGGDIDAARARVGWDRVRVPSATRRGIAQGAATDAVRDVLHAAGMRRVLVDIGELAALGGPWRTGAADPDHGLFARVSLNGNALAVSSPGSLPLGDVTHILDPVGGRAPLWSSVAVVAAHAALADGLSTAACLMRRDELEEAIHALPGVQAVHLLDHGGGVRTITA